MININGVDRQSDLNASDRYACYILEVINLRRYFMFVFIFKKATLSSLKYYDITNELFRIQCGMNLYLSQKFDLLVATLNSVNFYIYIVYENIFLKSILMLSSFPLDITACLQVSLSNSFNLILRPLSGNLVYFIHIYHAYSYTFILYIHQIYTNFDITYCLASHLLSVIWYVYLHIILCILQNFELECTLKERVPK